jgi:hypothetical protein
MISVRVSRAFGTKTEIRETLTAATAIHKLDANVSTSEQTPVGASSKIRPREAGSWLTEYFWTVPLFSRVHIGV